MRLPLIRSLAVSLLVSLSAHAVPAADLLSQVKAKVAPDPRITLFDVKAEGSGANLTLSGRVLLASQKDALLAAFAADGNRHFGVGGAMKDVGHDGFLLFLDLRWVLSAARCPSECRSEASAASPPRPAMIAPSTSATAKAGDIA